MQPTRPCASRSGTTGPFVSAVSDMGTEGADPRILRAAYRVLAKTVIDWGLLASFDANGDPVTDCSAELFVRRVWLQRPALPAQTHADRQRARTRGARAGRDRSPVQRAD